MLWLSSIILDNLGFFSTQSFLQFEVDSLLNPKLYLERERQGDKCHFENWRNPCLSDFDDRPAPGVGVGGGDAGTVRTGVGSWGQAASRWRRQNGGGHSTGNAALNT